MVLLFPEASYSFDGTATPLPDSLGKFIKLLGVPVVFIETFGAFHRDPLYNGLRLRDVNVSAKVNYILSPEDTKEKAEEAPSPEENKIPEKNETQEVQQIQQEQQPKKLRKN